MRTIANHDQHELGFTSSKDEEIHFTRKAARAVITNSQGQIAVMHFTTTGAYKLPGGGIDEGEAVEDALLREVREETGWKVSDVRELGVLEEDRYYCGMHQTSYCFVANATEFVGTELTEREIAEGMELRWLDSIDKAIAAIETNSELDSNTDKIGHDMMTLREVAILRAAQQYENI